MKKSVLEQLKQISTVVADTGDFELIQKYKPVDATTNPSLILKAVKDEKYASLVKEAIKNTKMSKPGLTGNELVEEILMEILVIFGVKILSVIDGKVSSEVDARISFNTAKTIDYARQIIAKYEANNISKDRVLIKVAATWEGIEAAKILQQEGIDCNLTLIFDIVQAQVAAQAGAYLISPFVGRITDWQMQQGDLDKFPASDEDDGIQSVKKIYKVYKKHNFSTIVMAASFRNASQIIALAGCDALTISPVLLEELSNKYETLDRKLNENKIEVVKNSIVCEETFRWKMNENSMATNKLAEGIKQFAKDTVELEQIIKQYL